MQERDDKWDNDKKELKNKISEVQTLIEHKFKKVETRLQYQEIDKVRRRRQERKKNIIIK